MRNRVHARKAGLVVLFCLLCLVFCQPSAAGQWDRTPDITIGWTAWSDAEIVSKMATIILTRGMNYDVELTLADISVQYRGIAEGDLDAMLMSWQPKTHQSYLKRYEGQLVDLGPVYEGANLGWAVPEYVADSVASIADLAKPAAKKLFGGKIQGIDASAGLMALSKKAIDAYGIDYELLVASGPAMARRLGEAVEEKSPIVVTGWRPHWMFAEYPIRYLEDPRGIFKSEESVHVLARKGFEEDHPEVAAFFRRMHLKLDELERLMVEARKTSHTEAVLDWIKRNPDRVRYWMRGKQE
ncbi:MAG: glycine betaine ABC transporter substrate-binding protein [Desulfatibacillaceae bacterium]